MSEIRVGDVSIEGGTVHIRSGAPPASPPVGATATGFDQAANAPAIRALHRLPVSSTAILLVSFATAVTGTVLNLAHAAWQDPLGALLGGGFLLPLGLGAAAFGWLKRQVERRPTLALRAAIGDDARRREAALLRRIERGDQEQTVDALARSTGWERDTLRRTLDVLLHEQRIVEDVNLDTGDIHYIVRDDLSA